MPEEILRCFLSLLLSSQHHSSSSVLPLLLSHPSMLSSKVMDVAWVNMEGVVLLELLSRPEKSLEDKRPEYQMGFHRQRVSFSPALVGASDPPWMRRQKEFFCPSVGGLLQGHIAMDVFSEEYFPCLGPTTVLVVVPDARLYILFTPKKRRKNEEIEAHSLHTSSLLDADLFPFGTSDFSTEQNRWAVFFFLCLHLTIETRLYRRQVTMPTVSGLRGGRSHQLSIISP